LQQFPFHKNPPFSTLMELPQENTMENSGIAATPGNKWLGITLQIPAERRQEPFLMHLPLTSFSP